MPVSSKPAIHSIPSLHIEDAERPQNAVIHGPNLAADTAWASRTDTEFDGTYRRHLLLAAKARGREK